MEQDITQSELNEMATNMKDVADGYDDAMAAIRARGLAAEVVSPQTEDTAMNAIDAAEGHAAEANAKAERPHMSTDESDYAKRVVELSMQLANSRADVENLRMRIKAVDKEHEQLKKDRADMVDRFDAALRRAKAEVLQEVMELCLRDPLFKQFVEKGFWGAHHVDIVWRHNGQDKQHEADWLKSLWYLLRKLDARAAQIEEGE